MVKPTTVNGGIYYVIFSYGTWVATQSWQLHIGPTGKLTMTNQGTLIEAPSSLSVGVWHCIIMTYNPANGAGLKYNLYVDNMVTPVVSGDMTTNTVLGRMHIAADVSDAGGGLSPLIGLIDEFRLYDKELSQSERVAYWNNGVGLYGVSDVSNGVIAYHFDELSGMAVPDYQQLNNSGLLINMEVDDLVVGIVRKPGSREGALASMGVGG